jgi:RNA polymerase sigma-70 factor (ECF subfamily)
VTDVPVPGDARPGEADAADDALIARVLDCGDVAAFGALVARYDRRAFALAFRLLRHREDAEDLVQDGFFAAFRRLATFQRGRPFGPWLYRIILNRGLNVRRMHERMDRETPAAPAAPEAPGLDPAERAELQGRFRAALAQLSARTRLVVQLVDVDGFERADVAAALGMSAATVRWHYHVGWRALRATLGPLFAEPGQGEGEGAP